MAIGDVEFAGTGEARYRLNFGANAMCRAEEATGKTFGQVMAEMNQPHPSITLVRQLMGAVLVEPEGQTPEQVGNILDDIGGAEAVVLAFKQAGGHGS
jgi:hypothetical protein